MACSQVTPQSATYDLLAIYVPAGAVVSGVRWQPPTARAGLVTATGFWAWITVDDYRALWGEFRLAYVVSFLSQERAKVASTSFHRIDEYAALARAVPGAPILALAPVSPINGPRWWFQHRDLRA